MFGCTAITDRSHYTKLRRKKKKDSSSSQVISAIPPLFPASHTDTPFYKTLIHKQVKHHIDFHYQSNHSYSTADAPTINSKPYSDIYPVVMYNRTGATLNTFKNY